MQDSTPGLTSREVDQIMEIVDGGSVDYVSLETDGLKVVVARDTYVPGLSPGQDAPVPTVQVPQVVAPPPVAEVAPVLAPPPAAAQRQLAEGEYAVTAPMTGICYLRPDPSSPPYVAVGDTLSEGDTVALVEVMKTFAAVTATVAGTVVDVLVGDGGTVSLGESMFVLRQG
jgi:acetyl-CoA carboxylase biotin carboxyl carrier protein